MAIENLRKNVSKVKSGNECIFFKNKNLNYNLLHFWQWSSSDLLSNATRGKFAEFIIASAMELDLTGELRSDWGEYDLMAWELGGIKIEVKSSSYLQSWEQRYYSNINFSIKKHGKTSISKEKNIFYRPSDVYVFCLLKHKDKKTVNPLNMNQWSFYVLSTKTINTVFKEKSSISLNSLEKITQEIEYNELKEKIIERSKENYC